MFAQAAREVFQVDASALRGCKVGVRGWSEMEQTVTVTVRTQDRTTFAS